MSNKMQDETFVVLAEWLEDQRLSWTDKVLLAKLYKLTREGTRDFVSPNLSSYLAKMGLTNLRHSWKRLVECGYITKTVDKLHGNVTTVAIVKMTQGYSQNDNRVLSKRHKGYSQNDTSSSTTINNLSKTLERTPLSNSSSFEDFMPVFNQLAEQFKDEHLAIGRMYLPTVVKKFFNHYQARKFRFKHGLEADATEWLLNECEHIECNLARDTKSENQCKHQQVMDAIGESIHKEAEQKGVTPRQITNEIIELIKSPKSSTVESEILKNLESWDPCIYHSRN